MMEERWKLQNACIYEGLSYQDLAEKLGVDVGTVSRWMDGTTRPSAEFAGKMCKRFHAKHPSDLDLHAEFPHTPTHRREDKLLTMLDPLDRRQLMSLLSKLSTFAGIDLVTLNAALSGSLVAPDDLLYVGRTVVDHCWNLLDQGSFFEIDNLLLPLVSKLHPIASRASQHKEQAASLALEATIIQMLMASHTMNYKRRVTLGEAAIQYGELSGNDNLYILALGGHGITYTDCYQQPGQAIAILQKATPLFDSTSPLNQTDISTGLAIACALDKDETNARNYIEQARVAMPENPQLDPLYRIIELEHSELAQREGQIYLILAKKFRSQKAEYGKLAYDALVSAMNQLPPSMRYQGKVLINKADAARLIGNIDDHFNSLQEGANIAFQVGSEKQKTKALYVLNNTPRSWRTDARYIELRKLLTPPQVIQ